MVTCARPAADVHRGSRWTDVDRDPERIRRIAVCGAALLAGCWTLSIEPLYTEETLTYTDDLVGTWGNPDDPDDETSTFLPESDSTYRLIIKEEGEPDGVFEAHLVRLDGRLYLDLLPEEPECGGELYVSHMLPAHSFWLTSLEGHALSLDILDPDWIKENIDAGRVAIDHVRRDDAVVLTASTPELQQFVIAHADSAFTGEPLVLERQR